MPRYYFNVFGGDDTFDDVGTELQDRAEARERMIFIALGIAEKLRVDTADTWQMEVLDETGGIVATMDFGIEVGRRSPAKRH